MDNVANRDDSSSTPEGVTEVAVKPRRGFSIIWLIPFVAGLTALWLGYTTLTERGSTITITFETAEGLEADRTKVKYKEVEVGLVEDVGLSDDLSRIVVTAKMHREADRHLTEGTRFWVVRPRLTAGGVSGLGTLVSGAFIEMDPGTGARTRKYIGLEEPPVVRSNVPGREYLLTADKLGSLSPGSPVYYRGLTVGEVLGYALAEDGRSVHIPVFVRAPHDTLVRDDSRFWNATGIDVSVGADGVKVRTESMQALLTGGIAFDTPNASREGEPSPEGTAFKLFENFASIAEAQYTKKIPYLLYFDGSVRGLQAGAPVEFKGIKVGTVTDVRLEFDAQTQRVRIPVTIETEPERVAIVGSQKQVDPYVRTEKLVEQGLRAQLKPGNLLTGQLVVALDFYPDSPPEKMRYGDTHPAIPTVPSDLEEIQRSASQLLDKIAALPLAELTADAREAVQSVDRLISSPALQQSVESLRATTEAARTAVLQAQTTLSSAEDFVSKDSQFRYELTQLIKELKDTSRSVRVLADYLERHPEALLRGKGGKEN